MKKFICIKCYNQSDNIKSFTLKYKNNINLNCHICNEFDSIHVLKDIKINWDIAYKYTQIGISWWWWTWQDMIEDSAYNRNLHNKILLEIYNGID